jgi:glycosyltransferase involved in cell wall biosynthesis
VNTTGLLAPSVIKGNIRHAQTNGMRLSVLIPVHNERQTLATVVESVMRVATPHEIIVVDDGSTDGSQEVAEQLRTTYPATVRYTLHPRNLGKGAALRTALAQATGDVVMIQDADLEYHPEDYPAALRLIETGYADAVYGSRFLGPHRAFLFWHYAGNRVLTLLCNLLTSGILTDMETGFKMVRADVMKALELKSLTFNIEVEITVKLFRYGYRVYEIPITYTGRTYSEGKKVTWKDGVRALVALFKWGLIAKRSTTARLDSIGCD